LFSDGKIRTRVFGNKNEAIIIQEETFVEVFQSLPPKKRENKTGL